VTAKSAEQTKEQYENVTGSSEIVNETPNAQSTGDGSQAGNAQNMNHAGNTGNYQQSYQQTNYQQAPNNGAYTPKSKMAAGLLGIFLGGLGIHNFYLGNTNRALIQLLVGVIGGAITCGLASIAMWIWGLVEGIQILSGTITTDAQGNPLVD
ncbi:MAG: NINE protein, partial [bacterium]|nr:NINE protein [bacterium]